MQKTKVENISNINLDFFLKQNKEDIRVNLAPGETSWCDVDSTTRSMILYERKHLIKSSPMIESLITDAFYLVEVKPMNPPTAELLFHEITTIEKIPTITIEEAKKQTVEYTKEKTYKGKKRGRKKKRGPKKGSRKPKPTTDETK